MEEEHLIDEQIMNDCSVNLKSFGKIRQKYSDTWAN